jgi:hypothetical protein
VYLDLRAVLVDDPKILIYIKDVVCELDLDVVFEDELLDKGIMTLSNPVQLDGDPYNCSKWAKEFEINRTLEKMYVCDEFCLEYKFVN